LRLAIGFALTAAALALAGRRLWWLWRLVTVGKPAPDRFKDVGPRLWAELTDVFGQRKLLKRPIPGLAHFFVFWGFIILFFTIIEAYGLLFSKTWAIPGIGHSAWLGFLEDFMAVAVFVGIVTFSIIRLRQSPERLDRSSRFYKSHGDQAWLILGLIFLVVATLLLYRAFQVDLGHFAYGNWAFASHGLANAFTGLSHGVLQALETTFVLAQIGVIAIFLVVIVYSKHLHIIVSEPNVLFSRRPNALGPLATTPNMDPEELSEDDVFGAGEITHFTWKQLLDLLSCTECGRCQDQCPAWNTGKPLSPKLVIMDLRDNLFGRAGTLLAPANGDGSVDADGSSAHTTAPARLVPDVIEPDVLWSCTTCGACVEQCPVDIEHVDTILDMRRYEVLMESSFPTEGGTMLRNIENQGDPWGLGSTKRLDWTHGLPFEVPVVDGTIPDEIEYLFWVGCAGALDERARKVTQAIARLLHDAGVRFAVLGPRESCTGDPARRLGNEYLYQTQCQQNVETLDGVGARKVIASCPHCFNTISREYPALGGNYEVVHHSQLLARLVDEGRITPGQGVESTVTYHDPCYLGRHNSIYDQPRSVLSAVPGVEQVEMHRHRQRGFCCGAGGARMWLEEDIGKRVNLERTDEALRTGADVVGTACPYCMIMLDDGVKQRQADGVAAESTQVLDVAQILERSAQAKAPKASDATPDADPAAAATARPRGEGAG
jgi:Fe-S oxidoreductase